MQPTVSNVYPPPGSELQPTQPYGYAEILRHDGGGDNALRTSRACQPRALKVGDILAEGSRVLALPREGGNGAVLVKLTQGYEGAWISMPSRIPVALLTAEDKAPAALWHMALVPFCKKCKFLVHSDGKKYHCHTCDRPVDAEGSFTD